MRIDKFKKESPEPKRCVCSAVDVCETEKEIILTVDMPGVDRKTLNVDLQGDQLTIVGHKPKDVLDGKYTPYYEERASGIDYYRTFQISSEIDREKIRAEYTNGVLEIRLGKSQEVQPKKIEIQTN